jgi:hypothetical protein
MEIRVGPVSSTAARAWIANTTRVLDAVESHPGELEQPIPDDVLELFRSFLRQWEAVAASTDEFRWVARSNPSDAKHIVTHWASIDLLTDEQLDRLGISWAPPEAAPFFSALTSGVIEALNRHEETTKLAARVSELWANHLDKS